jgi:zinc D-Ala-D-Ala dipeptidase
MTLRPWSGITIAECGEPLQPLPPALLRLLPHPYAALGAPYGSGQSPFQLRSGVVARLLQAQQRLQASQPHWRLAIFDAWRPVAVQQFMVEHTIAVECHARGLDPGVPSPARDAVVAEVGRFWAPPSLDAATPPPHSTGAAVDLTLADAGGQPLPMGGAIDALGPISEPDYYAAWEQQQRGSPQASWHQRRKLLRQCLQEQGFAQHPNEWWHFSHGDQLWAWRSGASLAIYGRVG